MGSGAPVLYLEAAVDEDLPAILAVERESFSQPWTPGNFRQALQVPERGRVVVLRAPFEDVAGHVLGYCVFEVVVDEMHVHNLAVHPSHRGRGLGRLLLRQALTLGAGRGACSAHLEVRQSNWPALHLYRSMGFHATSIRRDYYVHPVEDALVLQTHELSRGPMPAR